MSTPYFHQLNYTLANEDSWLERAVMPLRRERIVAVAGSGGRVVPLLTRGVSRLSVVDLSAPQLALTELRLALIRETDHETFLGFFSYPGAEPLTPGERERVFRSIGLRSVSRDCLEPVLRAHGFESPLLLGRWERTFIGFSRLSRWIMGRERIERLFSFRDLPAQKEFLHREWRGLRWNALISIAGNARTFNTLLYSGDFPVNNSGSGYVRYYRDAFDRLFAQGPARENFFLQLTLLGDLRFREGLPAETDSAVFEEAKRTLGSLEVEWVCEDLVSWLGRQSGVDFISFSNVASYFKPPLEQEFLGRIRHSMNPGARLVLRHYLHRPEGLSRDGYREVTSEFERNLHEERMQMYGVEILQKEAA